MVVFIFSILALLIAIPIVFIIPINITNKGKLMLVALSFLLTSLGLLATIQYSIWFVIPALIILAALLAYIVESRYNHMFLSSAINDEQLVVFDEGSFNENEPEDRVSKNVSKDSLVSLYKQAKGIEDDGEDSILLEDESMDLEDEESIVYSDDEEADLTDDGSDTAINEKAETLASLEWLEDELEELEDIKLDADMEELQLADGFEIGDLEKSTDESLKVEIVEAIIETPSDAAEDEELSEIERMLHELDEGVEGSEALPITMHMKSEQTQNEVDSHIQGDSFVEIIEELHDLSVEEEILIGDGDVFDKVETFEHSDSLSESDGEEEDLDIEETFIESRDGLAHEKSSSKELGGSVIYVDEVNAPVESKLEPENLSVEEDPEIKHETAKVELTRGQPSIQKEMFQMMREQLVQYQKKLSPNQFEELVLAYLHPSLPDKDYYSFAKILMEHYILTANIEKLVIYANEIHDRFKAFPGIVAEIELYKSFIRPSVRN
ncbi:MPP10 family protein [Falsibacillus albus]|uniref:Uncharacterized protein n=1 Tax=Falsibacillus albus TaxID=2478915 RepID=A0A3L7K719_9BACI|nr:hypothetical protein [Falsibacillus albus]RLQ98044.1 hypothetical protein D9X91_01255 [Falsibacillus albus]